MFPTDCCAARWRAISSDFKGDFAGSAAEVEAVQARANSCALKQREGGGPIGAGHRFHALAAGYAAVDDVVRHVCLDALNGFLVR